MRGAQHSLINKHCQHLAELLVAFRKWLTALPGGVEQLRQGIRVCDLGCGSGSLAITLGAAFPNSRSI